MHLPRWAWSGPATDLAGTWVHFLHPLSGHESAFVRQSASHSNHNSSHGLSACEHDDIKLVLEMPKYTEDDLKTAISSVAAGLSIRKAAQQWGVPRSTVRERIHGSQTREKAYERWQRLSATDEKSVVKWVLAQASLDVPVTHQQLRNFVTHVLARRGDNVPLGKNWVDGFLRRHPEIVSRKGGLCHDVGESWGQGESEGGNGALLTLTVDGG